MRRHRDERQLLASCRGGVERTAVAVGDADEHDAAAGARRRDRVIERPVVARRLVGDVDRHVSRIGAARPECAGGSRTVRERVGCELDRDAGGLQHLYEQQPDRSAAEDGGGRLRSGSAEIDGVQRDAERLEQRGGLV